MLIALSGLTMILANAIPHWDRLFIPRQDFWILAAGIPLTHFAYSLPHFEPSREGKIAIAMVSIPAFIALVYCLIFDYRFLFHWTLELNVYDTYYLLLPLGILFIVIIFLRRTVQLSTHAVQGMNQPGPSLRWQSLIHPQGEDALVSHNMAIALSIAFLPALQTLIGLPDPYGFILSNIGSILATIAIAFVYFSYAPEVNSFMGKLVGITLITVLLIFSVFGSIDVNLAQRFDFSADRIQALASIHEMLVKTEDNIDIPPKLPILSPGMLQNQRIQQATARSIPLLKEAISTLIC
jgi:hypothetical protein